MSRATRMKTDAQGRILYAQGLSPAGEPLGLWHAIRFWPGEGDHMACRPPRSGGHIHIVQTYWAPLEPDQRECRNCHRVVTGEWPDL